jgi:hypothetical protein
MPILLRHRQKNFYANEIGAEVMKLSLGNQRANEIVEIRLMGHGIAGCDATNGQNIQLSRRRCLSIWRLSIFQEA